jgi:broad specificity phosphatase PhoE
LRNLDHGLWHGKLIEEVKQNQPKMYRQGQENAAAFCPPAGEPVALARQRAQAVLSKLIKKHKSGTVALVVPQPLTSVVLSLLQANEISNVWKAEQDCGVWTLIEIPTGRVPVRS